MRRHMLDPSPDRGLCGIGAGGGLGHGLSLGLATVDATGQHTIGQPCFVRPRAVCCVGPDLAAAIHCDQRRNMRPSACAAEVTSPARMNPYRRSMLIWLLYSNTGNNRSEERRGGTECVSKCRSRCAPYH